MQTTTRVRACLATAAAGLAALAVAAPASAAESFLVLYKAQDVPASAKADIAKAGGTLVAAYDEIGVAVARSGSSAFAARMSRTAGVEAAAATTGFASKAPAPPSAPASDNDTFSPLQWDMRQIDVPEAHAITGGSPSVLVGNIDTGGDKDHPDLDFDETRSVSCESGAPDPNPAAWDDRHGHGTHTAGTIAAKDNGFGIVGVAPHTKIATIKASTDAGYFFPEMVVCAFMHAGRTGMDVTNNSYYADPWRYNCRNDATQRAIWKAEQRAVRFAQQQGTLVVASAGNDGEDTSHPTTDSTSPDYPPGNEQDRRVTNACLIVPTELPGVVGVSALSPEQGGRPFKSFYSNWGVSTIDLAAPGGDSTRPTPQAPNGRVLSTWPAEIGGSFRQPDPAGGPNAMYRYAQGTSMAGPHVAGVAALILARYGDMPQGALQARLEQSATPLACEDEVCQGNAAHTSYYGAGQVNALRAVTR